MKNSINHSFFYTISFVLFSFTNAFAFQNSILKSLINFNQISVKSILASASVELDTLVVTDYDGNVYRTVRIGDQVWMAENLKSTHYSDGTPISFFEYNNDSANVYTYGRLYSWTAVMNGEQSSNSNPSNVQGISPEGWHLPSRAEWQQLVSYFGGSSIAGGKLKEAGTVHWNEPNTGATNESGFTALPAGMYAFWQQFQWIGDYCAFTSCTDISVPTHPAMNGIKLSFDSAEMIIGEFHPDDALSVRCIKDDPNTDVIYEHYYPGEFCLYQNFPNPFNPSTTINYSLSNSGNVVLKIFNSLGEEVKTLVKEYQSKGVQSAILNANSSMPAGVYFYRLQAGDFVETKKMVLLK